MGPPFVGVACGMRHSLAPDPWAPNIPAPMPVSQDPLPISMMVCGRAGAGTRLTSDHYVLGTWQKFQLPRVKFILPYWPKQPVTLNGRFRMPSWYDIKSLYRIASNKDEAGMNTSMLKIKKFIESEINSGIPAGRIVLGGFSQGDAMTLFTGLQSEYRLGGLAVLSGYLPIRDRILKRATDASKSVPIFQAHGTTDEVVLLQYG
ncbi:hypothetical protein H4S07_000182 [Coemansia furcata]|uniref:Uncharacterized protein n=1 Tax=Coemansia furcata TaxID=417177 RepID=A0ACC1LSY7_9FUNG|nr:hypothetical protein H4S07_000182 [Coemansia furcata]